MAKGFHQGRLIVRQYTAAYTRLFARDLKDLLTLPLGNYSLTDESSSISIELKELDNGVRFFRTINTIDRQEIGLIKCDKSASKKLYLTCPYCQIKRQHLYEFKKGYSCKACLKLSYASQSEGKQERLARRIRKLRKKIWDNFPDINNLIESSEYFPKPKYKRWAKYELERAQVIELEKEFWGLASSQFHRVFGEDWDSYKNLM